LIDASQVRGTHAKKPLAFSGIPEYNGGHMQMSERIIIKSILIAIIHN
jgi:hypothetical protein